MVSKSQYKRLEELGFRGNRATTAEEKKAVTARLLTLWQTFPELRLGQLIGNALEGVDLYYIEDYDLISVLESEYLSISNK